MTWAAVGNRILALALVVQQLIDYIRNVERHRDDVCAVLDDAIDGLRDATWTGPIHLLGYSVGSLVMFDALHPKASSLMADAPMAEVSSLATIGCPIDLVRLFDPRYGRDRVGRASVAWTNIYNPADVFSSNLRDHGDAEPGDGDVVADLASFTPTSIRYLDEDLTIIRILLARGFRTHSGYWGDADGAHCFATLVPTWMPPAESPESAGSSQR